MPRDEKVYKPGNDIWLFATFAQIAPPTFPPSSPPPQQTIQMPDGTMETIYGTLYDPPGPIVVVVHGADGSQTTLSSPATSSTGLFYIKFTIPNPAWAGTWCHRWYQQGVVNSANFLAEKNFEVAPTNF